MAASTSPSSGSGISIALTTYNGQAYLEPLLDSLARQKLLPTELVVSDDTSADNTVPLLEAFAQRAPFPVHIHPCPSQLGVLNNFYRAFSLCASPFIAYCDQDDIWMPEKLAKCHSKLAQPGVVLVSHSSRLTDSELRPLGIVQPDNLDPGLYHFPHFPLRYWGFGHQMIFSRELLPVMNRLRGTVSPDSVPMGAIDRFIPIVAGMLGDTVYIPEPLVDFRRHDRAESFVPVIADSASASAAVSVSVNDRLARKRLDLAEVRTILVALRDWIAQQGLKAESDGERWARYADYLDRTLRAVESRLDLHQSTDRVNQARAFTRALGVRAYRDPRRGGAGLKQILVDLLALLKHARELTEGGACPRQSGRAPCGAPGEAVGTDRSRQGTRRSRDDDATSALESFDPVPPPGRPRLAPCGSGPGGARVPADLLVVPDGWPGHPRPGDFRRLSP
jgi:glycosyltransferase involved in cell wall biosynthesis